jgi:hypothetical protein
MRIMASSIILFNTIFYRSVLLSDVSTIVDDPISELVLPFFGSIVLFLSN